MKRALITGIFGQDGSYLTELLSAKDYEVHGVVRAQLSPQGAKLKQHLESKGVRPVLHQCDLNSLTNIRNLIDVVRPDECYHLAAIHYPAQTVGISIEHDRLLLEQNIVSVLNLLQALLEVTPEARFVLAGSCLVYEDCEISPQNELTPLRSASAYGTSKIVGQQLTRLFRLRHQLHASTAILYNHESPRRDAHFVTQKIVKGLVSVQRGEARTFQLGNLDDVKDWGFAGDYVHGMWLMAQADSPDDYVLATGTGRTVADLANEAAGLLQLENWRDFVKVQSGLTRPATRARLVGDPEHAQKALGWERSLDFKGLVGLMVQHELSRTLD